MLTRRAFFGTLTAGFVVAWSVSRHRAQALQQSRAVTLRSTLQNGLRTRRTQDIAFIDKVVNFVTTGALPEDFVKGVFAWARRKPEHRFQFFRQAMIILARERHGVVL